MQFLTVVRIGGVVSQSEPSIGAATASDQFAMSHSSHNQFCSQQEPQIVLQVRRFLAMHVTITFRSSSMARKN